MAPFHGRVGIIPSSSHRIMRLELEYPLLLLLLGALPIVVVTLRYTLVDSPRVQLGLSAVIRCVVLLLLILSLGSLLWVSRSEDVALLVLADLSDSVTESAPAQVSNLWSQVA